jgi:FlaA1/EpsC-like NDP-sugar epimerase
MLRRDRHIRTQIHQLVDACLCALAFLVAYELRVNLDVIRLLHLPPFSAPFETYVWVYVLMIPAAPLVFEAQGLYNRSFARPRLTTMWVLFRGCFFLTLGLILLLFLLKQDAARAFIIAFGFIAWAFLFLKEESLRLALRTRFGQEQVRRRFALVGSAEETTSMQAELIRSPAEDIEIVAQFDLNTTPVGRLVEVLHDHSVNGVILSAKRSQFQEIEDTIRLCELEGVEVWLVADFFRAQLSRTSFDDFTGALSWYSGALPRLPGREFSSKFLIFCWRLFCSWFLLRCCLYGVGCW